MADVAEFDRLVARALKGAGNDQRDASEQLLQLRRTAEAYNIGLHFLLESNNDLSQFEAIRITKESALSEWGVSLAPESALEIADEIFRITSSRKSTSRVLNVAASAIATFYKRAWPVGVLSKSDTPQLLIAGGNDDPSLNVAQAESYLTSKIFDLVDRSLEPSSLNPDFPFRLSMEMVNEFSALTASELKTLWIFHVKCHKSFELRVLQGLFCKVISYTQDQLQNVAQCGDSATLENICMPLAKALDVASRILAWEFQANSDGDDEISSALSNAKNKGASLEGGRDAHVDAALASVSVRPGKAWAPILLNPQLLPILGQLYSAVNTGNAMNPGQMSPPCDGAHASPEELFAGEERRDLQLVSTVSQKIYDVLVQLASLRGDVFASENEDLDAFAHLSQILLVLGPIVSRITTINEHLAAERECRMQELRTRFREQRSNSSNRTSFVNGSCVVSEPDGEDGVGGYGGLDDELGLSACEIDVPDSYQQDVSSLCRIFHRLSKNYPLICLNFVHPMYARDDSKMADQLPSDSTFFGLLWQMTQVVLSPVVVAQFGSSAIDTWAAESLDILLDAWSAIASALVMTGLGSAPSTEAQSSLHAVLFVKPEMQTMLQQRNISTDAAAIQLIELAMQPLFANYCDRFIAYYVKTRLSLAAEEALRQEDEVNERFYGTGSSSIGSYFGDFLSSLAQVARVNIDATLDLLRTELSFRVQTLRNIATEAFEQSAIDLTDEQTKATLVCQEGIWWLLEFLSHVLVDETAGEQPLIPTSLLYRSLSHYVTDCAEVLGTSVIDTFIPEVTQRLLEQLFSGEGPSVSFARESNRSSPLIRLAESCCTWLIVTNMDGQINIQSSLPSDSSSEVISRSSSTDSLVSIMDTVIDLMQTEGAILSESIKFDPQRGVVNNKLPVLSPYTATSLIRFLEKWSQSYLFPSEALYATYVPSLWAIFGDSNGRRYVEEIVTKIQLNLLLWGEESSLSEQSCKLLSSMIKNTRVREHVVVCGGFEGLKTAYRIAALSDPWFRHYLPDVFAGSAFPNALTSLAEGVRTARSNATETDLALALAFLVPLKGPVVQQLTQALATAAGYASGGARQREAIGALCLPMKLRFDELMKHPLLNQSEEASGLSEEEVVSVKRHLKYTLFLLRGLSRSDGPAYKYSFAFTSHILEFLPRWVRFIGDSDPSIVLQILAIYCDIASRHIIFLSPKEANVFMVSCTDTIRNFLSVFTPALSQWASSLGQNSSEQSNSASHFHHNVDDDDADDSAINDDESFGGDIYESFFMALLNLLKSISSRQSIDLSDVGLADTVPRAKSVPSLSVKKNNYSYNSSADEDSSQSNDQMAILLKLVDLGHEIASADPLKLIVECISEGIIFMAPLIMTGLVQVPKLAQGFFELLANFLTSTNSNIQSLLPRETCEQALQSILWGITRPHMDISRPAIRITSTLAEAHCRQVRDFLNFAKGRRPKGDQNESWELLEANFGSNIQQASPDWLASLPYRSFLREAFMRLLQELFFEEPSSNQISTIPSAVFSISVAFGEEDYFCVAINTHSNAISELFERKCRSIAEQKGIDIESASDYANVVVGIGEFDLSPEIWMETLGMLISEWNQSQGNSEASQLASDELMKTIPGWIEGLPLSSPTASSRASTIKFKKNLNSVLSKVRSILKIK